MREALLTLVAMYGDKPPALARLLADCQARLAATPGLRFRPYDLRQVHATLIGLEPEPDSPRLNRNLLRWRGVRRPADILAFVARVRSCRTPIEIRLGGFAETDEPFTSRGQRPYLRSFSVQDDKAVLIGWPVEGDDGYPSTLSELRRLALRDGILHAYHRRPRDRDNDFYLRVGILDPAGCGPEAIGAAEVSVRSLLAERPPTRWALTAEQVAVAAYTDESLPWGLTSWCTLADPGLDGWLRARVVGGFDERRRP